MLSAKDVSAVVVTRGGYDISDVLKDLPYDEVIVWDNSVERDYKFYGSFHAALTRAKHDVIYFQDDDLIFSKHDELLAAYEPGRLISNMSEKWITDLHYYDLAFTGPGSLIDKSLIQPTFDRYLARYPEDQLFYNEAAMIFGVLVPYKRIDFGFDILPRASEDDRMWKQEWHQRDKWVAANRARALRTVTLCMMVKDEADYIEAALRTAAPLYESAYILDTGSTDGTQALAAAVLESLDKPYLIEEQTFEPWDFATARNASLVGARKMGTDFIFLMDGDEVMVEAENGWPDVFDTDATFLDYERDLSTPQPRIIRSWQPWEYRGRVHATPYLDEMKWSHSFKSPRMQHMGEERHLHEKIASDVVILREMYQDNPTDPRTVFNLAKALEGAGEFEEACALYYRRAQMQGLEEEAWYAHFRYAGLLARVSSFEEGALELIRCWQSRRIRAEPLRLLADYCVQIADRIPLPETEVFFVQRSAYKPQDNTEGSEDAAAQGS